MAVAAAEAGAAAAGAAAAGAAAAAVERSFRTRFCRSHSSRVRGGSTGPLHRAVSILSLRSTKVASSTFSEALKSMGTDMIFGMQESRYEASPKSWIP